MSSRIDILTKTHTHHTHTHTRATTQPHTHLIFLSLMLAAKLASSSKAVQCYGVSCTRLAGTQHRKHAPKPSAVRGRKYCCVTACLMKNAAARVSSHHSRDAQRLSTFAFALQQRHRRRPKLALDLVAFCRERQHAHPNSRFTPRVPELWPLTRHLGGVLVRVANAPQPVPLPLRHSIFVARRYGRRHSRQRVAALKPAQQRVRSTVNLDCTATCKRAHQQMGWLIKLRHCLHTR